MNATRNLLKTAHQHLLYVTDRPPVVMARGSGMYLTDTAGKRYLDFVGGWAVTALGHCPAAVTRALRRQSERLVNCSPSFYNDLMIELAGLLAKHSCLDRAWFGNTGAEVNEAAVKLARKYGAVRRNGAFEIITTLNSFHGRTLAMMSATGKKQWKALFEPKVPGFVHVPYNDLAAVEKSIGAKTAAMMLEPVQGEGGVITADREYLRELRRLCDRHGILLILDEIQTGLGRTGKLFACEHYGIEPDIMTLGKGIGGGYPLAALLAKEKCCLFEAGEHGGTYGGNALGMAVGIAVVTEIVRKDLSARAAAMGEYLTERLETLSGEFGIRNIRGKGLLIAADLPVEAGKAVVAAALKRGLILNSPQPASLRFIPPLIVGKKHIDEMIGILQDTLREVFR